MKDEILIELADRWDREANINLAIDASEEAKVGNALAQGHRECKRECADALRVLVSLLGDRE